MEEGGRDGEAGQGADTSISDLTKKSQNLVSHPYYSSPIALIQPTERHSLTIY